MSPTGGSTEEHDPEFDRVAWFQSDEALNTLTHATEAGVLREAMRRIQSK